MSFLSRHIDKNVPSFIRRFCKFLNFSILYHIFSRKNGPFDFEGVFLDPINTKTTKLLHWQKSALSSWIFVTSRCQSLGRNVAAKIEPGLYTEVCPWKSINLVLLCVQGRCDCETALTLINSTYIDLHGPKLWNLISAQGLSTSLRCLCLVVFPWDTPHKFKMTDTAGFWQVFSPRHLSATFLQ